MASKCRSVNGTIELNLAVSCLNPAEICSEIKSLHEAGRIMLSAQDQANTCQDYKM